MNLLKSVAAVKVFDVSGMNSIDAARISPAFDVLVWASEDKEKGEAEALDYEERNKNH